MLGTINGMLRLSKTVKLRTPKNFITRGHHEEGPPQPFDNMPFSIPNRFAATGFFCIFFGVGLWAPYLIVWYSMAKKTM